MRLSPPGMILLSAAALASVPASALDLPEIQARNSPRRRSRGRRADARTIARPRSSTSSRPARRPSRVGATATSGFTPTRWCGDRPSWRVTRIPVKPTLKPPGVRKLATLPLVPAVVPPTIVPSLRSAT